MVWLCILGGVEKSSWLLPVWHLPDLPCFCRLWIQELEPGNWDLPCQSGAVRTLARRELCRGCCRARSVGRIGLEQVCMAQLSWGCELWKLRLPSSLIDKLAAYSDENHFGVQIQFLLEMNLFKLLGQLPVFQWIMPVTCPWLGVYTQTEFYLCCCNLLLHVLCPTWLGNCAWAVLLAFNNTKTHLLFPAVRHKYHSWCLLVFKKSHS